MQISFQHFLSLEWVELEETYSLSAVNTLQDAVHTIIKFLGLGPANSTEKVTEGTHTHTLVCSGKLEKFRVDFLLEILILSGVFRGGAEILLRAKLALADGVTLQLTVRSTDQDIAEIVSSAIG